MQATALLFAIPERYIISHIYYLCSPASPSRSYEQTAGTIPLAE